MLGEEAGHWLSVLGTLRGVFLPSSSDSGTFPVIVVWLWGYAGFLVLYETVSQVCFQPDTSNERKAIEAQITCSLPGFQVDVITLMTLL